MPTAMIDHLEVNYLTRGSGPALLMLAPGGFDAKLNGGDRLARHMRFARENGLAGVVKRAHAGKSFWQDPEAGPWASVIVRDPRFADEFQDQDLDRYLGLVPASARALFDDRDMPPGAEPEELMAMKVPALIIPGDAGARARAHSRLRPRAQVNRREIS